MKFKYISNKYVKSEVDQVFALPAASAALNGAIYQYIGDDSNYDRGHFYECYNVSGSTYAWQKVDPHISYTDVQVLSSGSTSVTFTEIPNLDSSIVEIYTDVPGFTYESIEPGSESGSLKINFTAPSNNVTVILTTTRN